MGIIKKRREYNVLVPDVVGKTGLIGSKAAKKADVKINLEEEQLIYKLIKEGSVSEVIIVISNEVVSHKTVDEYPQSKLLQTVGTIINICNAFHSNRKERDIEVMGALKIKCLLSDDFQKISIFSPEKGVLVISRMSFMEDEEKIVKIIEDHFNAYKPLKML